jgi:hypothetical protein
MEYVGDEPRVVPQFGLYQPGDVVNFDETLYNTGLFRVKENKQDKKDGEE